MASTMRDIWEAWVDDVNAKSKAFTDAPSLQTLYEYAGAIMGGVNTLFGLIVNTLNPEIEIIAQRVSLLSGSQTSVIDALNEAINQNTTRLGDEIAAIKRHVGMSTGIQKIFGRQ